MQSIGHKFSSILDEDGIYNYINDLKSEKEYVQTRLEDVLKEKVFFLCLLKLIHISTSKHYTMYHIET